MMPTDIFLHFDDTLNLCGEGIQILNCRFSHSETSGELLCEKIRKLESKSGKTGIQVLQVILTVI